MNPLALVLIAVLLGLAGIHLYRRFGRKRKRSEIKALLEDCNGDQDLVERLIFAEMQRDESLTIHAAARAARVRLQRDRAN